MLLVLCPAAPLTSEQAESAGVARPEMKLSRGAWVPELRTEHLPSDDSERGAGGRANFLGMDTEILQPEMPRSDRKPSIAWYYRAS